MASAFRPAPVIGSLQIFKDKAGHFARGVGEAQDQLAACAVIIGASNDAAKGRYKAAIEKTFLLTAEIAAYQGALLDLSASYRPSDQRTDFAARLAADTAAILAEQRFDVSKEPLMQEVVKDLGLQADAAADGEEDEEDMVVASGADKFVNQKCPLTMVSIFQLEDPVEDSKGYIYDKMAITAYIKTQTSRHGHAPCPQSGTSHLVTLAELKPSRTLAREKRRLALQATQATGSTQGERRGGAGDVLDVE